MTNEGAEKYSLHVRAGQALAMEMTSDNHQALFTLVKPSPAESKIEIVKNAGGVKRWSGTLTMSGDYYVTVFTQDQKANSHFKLRVTLRE